tara:strand:- start:721 stop:1305 length:585 start_codon:yes stop_codon:yes gene_type:complete
MKKELATYLNKYSGDTRYEKVWEQMQILSIQDVTTNRQHKNGTVVWKLPVKCQYGGAIHVASYKSGYVRRVKAGGYCDIWQLNKRETTKETFPKYKTYWSDDGDYVQKETGEHYTREYKTCKLIPIEIDRLEYMIEFVVKNYYIGYANKLSSGEFIPTWKHEDKLKDVVRDFGAIKGEITELKVIANGHRYNVI